LDAIFPVKPDALQQQYETGATALSMYRSVYRFASTVSGFHWMSVDWENSKFSIFTIAYNTFLASAEVLRKSKWSGKRIIWFPVTSLIQQAFSVHLWVSCTGLCT